MTVSVEDMKRQLGTTPEEQALIDQRAHQLMQEHQTLQDLRKARRFTQKRMAELLHVDQTGISKIERRSDMLFSTLQSYVEAMGGRLELVASFPDQAPVPVRLSDLLRPRRKKPSNQPCDRSTPTSPRRRTGTA